MGRNILIVGGGSSAGRSALQAVRAAFPDARVRGTTSQNERLADCDETITGADLNAPDVADRILAQADAHFDWIIFTPAFGPLGFPVRETTPEQVAEALRFSVHPMTALAEKLPTARVLSFSAFYWLEHTLAAYGSMAYAKLAQERLAVESPGRFAVVRAGTFRSRATRGITILMQRQMRSGSGGPGAELVQAWEKSGKKFGDFFFEYAFECERRAFGQRFGEPHRETTAADLTTAVRDVLAGQATDPIVNVIGPWRWTDKKLPSLGPDFRLVENRTDNL